MSEPLKPQPDDTKDAKPAPPVDSIAADLAPGQAFDAAQTREAVTFAGTMKLGPDGTLQW